jgi:hypothetical protein
MQVIGGFVKKKGKITTVIYDICAVLQTFETTDL